MSIQSKRRMHEPFVGAQTLERRRLLSAAIESRVLSDLFESELNFGFSVGSVIDVRGNASTSRVETPRSTPAEFGAKGPEGGIFLVAGTEDADHFAVSTDGETIVIELNGSPFTAPDADIISIVIEGLGGDDTVNIESNGDNATTVRGGEGIDQILLASGGGDLDQITSNVQVEGGPDGASLQVVDVMDLSSGPYRITEISLSRPGFGGVVFGSLTSLQLDCQDVGGTVFVESTPHCPVTVLGNGGDDVCFVTQSSGNLEDLNGTFTFDGGADTDSINIIDTANASNDTWIMTGDTFSRPSVDPITVMAEAINIEMGSGHTVFELNDFEQPSLSLSGGEGDDTLSVNGLGATSIVTFVGQAGSDTMNVEETAAGSEANFLGEGDHDFMTIASQSGDLANVAGSVSFNGGFGDDQISLRDDANPGESSYEINSDTLTRSDGFGGLTYTSLSQVTLNAQQGPNSVTIQNSMPATALIINGNGGDDLLEVAPTSQWLPDIRGSVNFFGGEDFDRINFYDTLREEPASYELEDGALFGTMFPMIGFTDVETAHLLAGMGADTINVRNSSPLVQIIAAGPGDDIINVIESVTPVLLNGGPGLDQFNVGTGVIEQTEGAASALALAYSLGEVEELQSIFVGPGSILAIDDNHTLTAATANETVIGSISFGHRSTYIGLSSTFPMPLEVAHFYTSAGYAGGAWTGVGGTFSSHASAASAVGDGIGYARASDIEVTSFNGVELNGDDMIFTQTLYADTNLDYTVDFDDLLKVAQNYNTPDNHWFEGDANYDLSVDFNDLLRVAQNYGQVAVFSERRIGSVKNLVLT